MQTKIERGARDAAFLSEAINEAALSMTADLLAVRTERAIDVAKQRNERWDGVFEERFEPADAYGWANDG